MRVLGFTNYAKEKLLTPSLNFRGAVMHTENDVNKFKKAMENLHLPCEMEDTGRITINDQKILLDENDNEWSTIYLNVERLTTKELARGMLNTI